MTQVREKFATQIEPELLASVRDLARTEGKQVQAVVEEALRDLVAKRSRAATRPSLEEAYAESLVRFDKLYRKLAE